MSAFKHVNDAIAFRPDKLAKTNLFDSANMFCDVYSLEPGQSQTAHAHAGSDKIYYVLSGNPDVQIGTETRRLGAGEIAHAAPGIAHGVSNAGPKRSTILVFMSPKP